MAGPRASLWQLRGEESPTGYDFRHREHLHSRVMHAVHVQIASLRHLAVNVCGLARSKVVSDDKPGHQGLIPLQGSPQASDYFDVDVLSALYLDDHALQVFLAGDREIEPSVNTAVCCLS